MQEEEAKAVQDKKAEKERKKQAEAERKRLIKEEKEDLKRGPGAYEKLSGKREFNENEIIGTMERNQLGLPVSMREDSKGNYVDSKGRKINVKGYLLDKRGHIVDQSNKLMFRKHQLTNDGELPVPASIDRFNFIPFKITGNFQVKPKSESDTLDNNKRMVNK